jgi:hypothetical protein
MSDYRKPRFVRHWNLGWCVPATSIDNFRCCIRKPTACGDNIVNKYMFLLALFVALSITLWNPKFNAAEGYIIISLGNGFALLMLARYIEAQL